MIAGPMAIDSLEFFRAFISGRTERFAALRDEAD